VHSYAGYDQAIGQLRAHVGAALGHVDTLIARQGHVIEAAAVEELSARRDRLEAYQVQARYAVADSYDRAQKAHPGGGTP
jgi:hypothetical protein